MSAIWGQIIGSVLGSKLGRKTAQADQSAIAEMNRANNEKWDMGKGLYGDALGRARNYLSNMTPVQASDFYAGLNPMQTGGYNYLNRMGQSLQPTAQNFLNTGGGFANNYADLYNRAGQDNLQNAIAYATTPSNYQGLVDSAMRDDARQLTESTLPNIDLSASSTGNMNSSRAGTADAIARRAYGDRYADVTKSVQDSLIGRSLANQQSQFGNLMNANTGLSNVFNRGFGMIPTLANYQTSAGGAYQSDAQKQLDATNQARQYPMDQIRSTLGSVGTIASPNYQANMYNPNMGSALGAMGGWGAGGQFQNAFSGFNPFGNLFGTQPTATPNVGGGYGQLGGFMGYPSSTGFR